MIRAKNIDYESSLMKLSTVVNIGPALSATESIIFASPYHCVIKNINVYPSVAITATLTTSIFLTTATTSLLTTNGSATAGSGEQIAFTITGNNSMTAGTCVSISFATTATAGFPGAVAQVIYIPKIHGEDT